jgi:menaquinol-cytochrome c reductase iron-sulfur subunit
MSDWEATPRDRPAEASAQADVPPSSMRRRFLSRLSVGLGGLAAAIAGVPVVGFLLSPMRRDERDVWRVVGALEDFPRGSTVKVTYVDAEPLPWAGYANESAAWLRRDGEDEFVAFSAYCTHTGCPVRWVAGAEMFMCPCHGGSFWRDGSVAAGPPPRPLERLQVRIRDGQVEVSPIGVPQTDG